MHMQIKNINVIVASLDRGGTEKFALTFCNFLVTKGHRVNLVVLLKSQNRDNFKLLSPDLNVAELDLPSSLLHLPLIFLKLRKSLLDDSDLTLGLHDLGNLATLTLNKKKSGKIVTTLRHEVPKFSRSPFLLLSLILCYWNAETTLVNSEYLASKLAKFKVNTKFFPNCPEFKGNFETKVVKSSSFKVFTIANLRPEKGLEILLEIADKMSNLPIEFVIAGSGELHKKLTGLIVERGLKVSLVGYVSDVSVYLAQSDLYLQTSISEGSPNSILEAMCHGIPIVASDIPSSREILGSEETLFSLTDTDSAVKLILKVIRDPQFSLELSKKNLHRVHASFNQDEIYPQMLDYLVSTVK